MARQGRPRRRQAACWRYAVHRVARRCRAAVARPTRVGGGAAGSAARHRLDGPRPAHRRRPARLAQRDPRPRRGHQPGRRDHPRARRGVGARPAARRRRRAARAGEPLGRTPPPADDGRGTVARGRRLVRRRSARLADARAVGRAHPRRGGRRAVARCPQLPRDLPGAAAGLERPGAGGAGGVGGALVGGPPTGRAAAARGARPVAGAGRHWLPRRRRPSSPGCGTPRARPTRSPRSSRARRGSRPRSGR